jgi:4-hydroxythreonine-4-phosphate dehydrogenase
MKPKIAITMGDPSGIGPEIILKALPKVYDKCVPVVIGDSAPLKKAAEVLGIGFETSRCEFIDCGLIKDWNIGKVDARCGEAAYAYVETAVKLALSGKAAAIVTAPLNKEALNLAGRHFSGHTEILASLTGAKNYAMMLIGGGLSVIHATTHVSMEDAALKITKERVYDVIKLGEFGQKLLGKNNPKIAVAGFNPHCSENGIFGTQEARAIIPAIEKAAAEKIDVAGPIPGDTVFVRAISGEFDLVVAMYHDQGHIPVKLLGFKSGSFSGVNVTVGTPVIRTSVDHGTAFDAAYKGTASEQSMIDAIETAIFMAKSKA